MSVAILNDLKNKQKNLFFSFTINGPAEIGQRLLWYANNASSPTRMYKIGVSKSADDFVAIRCGNIYEDALLNHDTGLAEAARFVWFWPDH